MGHSSGYVVVHSAKLLEMVDKAEKNYLEKQKADDSWTKIDRLEFQSLREAASQKQQEVQVSMSRFGWLLRHYQPEMRN